MKPDKKYTKGCEDVERVLEHLKQEEKKARQRAYLESLKPQHKKPKPKGGDNDEDISRPKHRQ